MIQILYNKWWRSAGTTCSRDDKNKEAKASALGFDNIGGVFVVLLVGLMSAVAIACIEFCWYAKVRDQVDCKKLPHEFAAEAKLAFNCMGSHKKKSTHRMTGATGIPRMCYECTQCGTRSPPESISHRMSRYDRQGPDMTRLGYHSYKEYYHHHHHQHKQQHHRRTSSLDRANSPIPPPPPLPLGQTFNHGHHHHHDHDDHQHVTSVQPESNYLPMMELMSPQTNSFDCPDCLYHSRCIHDPPPPDLHPCSNHVSPSHCHHRGSCSMQVMDQPSPPSPSPPPSQTQPQQPQQQHVSMRSPMHHRRNVSAAAAHHSSDAFDNDLISSTGCHNPSVGAGASSAPVPAKQQPHSIDHRQRRYHP